LNSIIIKQQYSWQEILSNTVNSSAELCRLLDLDLAALPEGHPLLAQFPVRVPLPFLGRMAKGDPLDPLLLQVFPALAEADPAPGYSADPVGEAACNPAPGILHKYHGRALLLVTSSCAIHCRYCFRRHFPYQDNQPGKQHWQDSLAYVGSDTSIGEIILSGGDPLTLPDSYLAWFYEQLASFSHVHRIRIHTRLPVMIPQRMTENLCNILANPRFQTILVLHSNHAREIDGAVAQSCLALRQKGITLLNQSVLLKGVNDSVTALAALSERLFETGVLPYYLHLLDRVTGASHYDVTEAQALVLIEELRNTLPGYLVPKLVREVPGEGAKSLVM
jgi:EF-P beta-lysylation protein EpmB